MQDAVVVKSFQNGISLRLREDVEFEKIRAEIARKFAEGRNFFGKASMALSIEGRRVSEAEEDEILDAIQSNSNISILCVVGHDEETEEKHLAALQQLEKKLNAPDEWQCRKGSVTDKEVVETDYSMIVLGDVNPGCAVISKGSIIVLGSLYGEAYAGDGGREGAYVAALEMEPERIKIGDFKYKQKEKQSWWNIRPKVQPKIAYVKNERILVEPLTKELLSSW
ncbi:MAG: septum site-determining protein MinC [Candidatus Gastranaerophilales bacterium]|nr:septum site-determining protein MinC [Candidatus Gastranaerophilales bacterium]